MKLSSILIVLLCLLLVGCVALSDHDQDKIRGAETVIYGEDNRVDYYQIQDMSVRINAKAVLSTWYYWQLSDLENGYYLLKTRRYGDVQNLHSSERFWYQPIGAHCTAFLVAPDIVVTAGHCAKLDNKDLKAKRFIFGYRLRYPSDPAVKIPVSDVYKATKIIARELTSNGVDYAVIKLDRTVREARPLKLAIEPVHRGDKVYILGHPSGLPLKYADDAKVLSVQGEYFHASLDSYAGNSGSPVFNEKHRVVGILVRGRPDFERDGDSFRSNRVRFHWGRGEEVVKTSVWRRFVLVKDGK